MTDIPSATETTVYSLPLVPTDLPDPTTGPPDAVAAAGEPWMTELGTLLDELTSITAANQQWTLPASEAAQARLVQLRLGIASSLFAALQCKHAATAGHGLRVALTSSAWARKMDMDPRSATCWKWPRCCTTWALSACPIRSCSSPARPGQPRSRADPAGPRESLEILRHSCTLPEILEIVENVAAWYDGSRQGWAKHGTRSPCPRG